MKFIQKIRLFVFAFPSLFLLPKEQGLESSVLEKNLCLKINGLIFKNPQSWSLWIGEEKFTPKNQISKIYDFQVVDVSDQEVKIHFGKGIEKFAIHDSFLESTGELCE